MDTGDSTQTLVWRPQQKTAPRGARLTDAAVPKGRIVPARFERRGGAPPQGSVAELPADAPPIAPLDEERLRRAVEDGRKEGRLRERAERAVQDLAETGNLLSLFRAAAVETMVELSCAVAERMLQREVERDPAAVERHAAYCLKRLPPNGPLKLRLHPKDREALLALSPRPEWLEEDGARLRLVADEALARGECVVESERGRVDGRRAASLEAAREVLRDVLAEAFPGGEP